MDQFLSMAFAQLTYRECLRDTVTCLDAAGKKIYHMGIRPKPTRSTLAQANARRRDWRIFKEFAIILVERAIHLCKDTPLSDEIDLKETVYALDSTTIDICLSLFPWARFRKRKGTVKLHTLLELRSSMPKIIYVTGGKVHDVRILDQLPLEPGAIYVMDRGYVDFGRLYRFCVELAFYVTRAKRRFDYRRVKSLKVNKAVGVLAYQIVMLNGPNVKKKYPVQLRRISFVDRESGRRFVFLTNNFELPAATIAFLYKCRWRVEGFFRWFKQNLRIKSFLGTSRNAVKTQIWIAIAVYALAIITKQQLGLSQSLYTILQVLSITIFEKDTIVHIHTKNKKPIF